METATSFGLWLKQRRRTLNLSQADLARCVNYSVAAIRKIEADERRPSRQIAELLADCLDIPLEERPTFLKVARAELRVERLEELSPATRSQPYSPPLSSTSSTPRPNLPVSLTSLLGREHELAGLIRLLQNPQCRLLTLVGPGGIGKTRLAIAAAARQRQAFGDGVYFVSLAPLSASEFIVSTTADVIGFTFYGQINPQAQLLNYLREKQMLLVLDNFEHLLPQPLPLLSREESSLGVITNILQQAPEVKLLVTSRERLNLQGEWVFEVQGFPTPPSDQINNLEAYSAVALFLDSAQRAEAHFEVKPAEWPAVVRICQLLEGMPLGIELAATWVRTLSCPQIAQQIERNLDFLASSLRDVPERHRSLRAAFDHSWKLLSTEEQWAMRQLSVFRGGFQREAAEQVTGARLPLLSALVDKSLLRRPETDRYDLHELLRQYAAEKLQIEASELIETNDRHSSYYLAWLHQQEYPLISARQNEVVMELVAEIDNLRLAWDWAVAQQQTAKIRQAVECLAWFHELRGAYQEGVTLFGRAVERLRPLSEGLTDPSAEQTATLGQVLAKQGFFLLRLGKLEEARHVLEQGVTLLRSLETQATLALALMHLGGIALIMGNLGEAQTLLQESLSLGRAINNRFTTAISLNVLGYTAQAKGEYQEAYRLFQEALGMWRALGAPRGIAFGLSYLSHAMQAIGKQSEAQQLLHESLEISRTIGDRWARAMVLDRLGLLSLSQGDDAGRLEAQKLLGESVTLFRELGDHWNIGPTLNHLGNLACLQEDYPEARQLFFEALKIALETQAPTGVLDALVGLAVVQVHEGTTESALELVVHVLQHPASSHEAKARAERLRVELEANLTPERIEVIRLRAQGRSIEMVAQELLASFQIQK